MLPFHVLPFYRGGCNCLFPLKRLNGTNRPRAPTRTTPRRPDRSTASSSRIRVQARACSGSPPAADDVEHLTCQAIVREHGHPFLLNLERRIDEAPCLPTIPAATACAPSARRLTRKDHSAGDIGKRSVVVALARRAVSRPGTATPARRAARRRPGPLRSPTTGGR